MYIHWVFFFLNNLYKKIKNKKTWAEPCRWIMGHHNTCKCLITVYNGMVYTISSEEWWLSMSDCYNIKNDIVVEFKLAALAWFDTIFKNHWLLTRVVGTHFHGDDKLNISIDGWILKSLWSQQRARGNGCWTYWLTLTLI